jgi:hypothetical protein
MINLRKVTLVLCILAVCPSVALGDVQLTVTSYSMFNGSTGAYNYQDTSYLPCPGNDCDRPGLLSGVPESLQTVCCPHEIGIRALQRAGWAGTWAHSMEAKSLGPIRW